MASGISCVDGSPYSATGTQPRLTMDSDMIARFNAWPPIAKVVAYGGCACTTALTSGRFHILSNASSFQKTGGTHPDRIRLLPADLSYINILPSYILWIFRLAYTKFHSLIYAQKDYHHWQLPFRSDKFFSNLYHLPAYPYFWFHLSSSIACNFQIL